MDETDLKKSLDDDFLIIEERIKVLKKELKEYQQILKSRDVKLFRDIHNRLVRAKEDGK